MIYIKCADKSCGQENAEGYKYNKGLIGMEFEKFIDSALRFCLDVEKLDYIHNPYEPDLYVKGISLGSDFKFLKKGLEIEAKDISLYLKRKEDKTKYYKQYISKVWADRNILPRLVDDRCPNKIVFMMDDRGLSTTKEYMEDKDIKVIGLDPPINHKENVREYVYNCCFFDMCKLIIDEIIEPYGLTDYVNTDNYKFLKGLGDLVDDDAYILHYIYNEKSLFTEKEKMQSRDSSIFHLDSIISNTNSIYYDSHLSLCSLNYYISGGKICISIPDTPEMRQQQRDYVINKVSKDCYLSIYRVFKTDYYKLRDIMLPQIRDYVSNNMSGRFNILCDYDKK